MRHHYSSRYSRGVTPKPLSPERQAALDAEIAESIHSQARRSAAWMMKRRARDYLARPTQLEILYPGLACVEPARMIAIGETLWRNEAQIQRHSQRIDMYQVKATNAKAVVLLGRYRRRFASRLAEVA